MFQQLLASGQAAPHTVASALETLAALQEQQQDYEGASRSLTEARKLVAGVPDEAFGGISVQIRKALSRVLEALVASRKMASAAAAIAAKRPHKKK